MSKPRTVFKFTETEHYGSTEYADPKNGVVITEHAYESPDDGGGYTGYRTASIETKTPKGKFERYQRNNDCVTVNGTLEVNVGNTSNTAKLRFQVENLSYISYNDCRSTMFNTLPAGLGDKTELVLTTLCSGYPGALRDNLKEIQLEALRDNIKKMLLESEKNEPVAAFRK